MKARTSLNLNRLIIATAIAGALAACGGGSSSTTATHTISGSAAVGAPLVGTVTVKDALGATKQVNIGTNGAYSVDVTGMTAPFVFRATGTANGQTYTVHSIATAADADGKINITQLTDLVVANIAGQIAQNYFDKFEQNSNATGATKAAIDAEVGKLKEKLQPILSALGVDAAVDLLRTPFTPLADKLDKALDAIQITVDPNTNTATISSVLSSVAIYDDLKSKAAAETSVTPLNADNPVTDVSAAVSDATLVIKALNDFSAKFATGLPSVSDLTPLLTTGFLNDDENSSTFLGWVSTETHLIGGSFTDVVIHEIDYSDTSKITARISFTVKTKDGIELARLQNWKVRKGTDGVWRLHGNQRVLALEAFASASKVNSATGSSSCVNSGLNFNIEDLNTANNGGVIDHILVTGPGLPSGGLRYTKPSLGGRWTHGTTGMTNYTMATDCGGMQAVADSVIAAIPDDSVYTITAYDSSNAKISFPSGTKDGTYGIKIHRRPMTLAEAKASTAFPVISADTVSAFAGFTSGALSFAASNVNASKSAWVRLIQSTTPADSSRDLENTVIPKTDGTVSTSFSLPALQSGAALTNSWLWIESPDAYRRNMETMYYR